MEKLSRIHRYSSFHGESIEHQIAHCLSRQIITWWSEEAAWINIGYPRMIHQQSKKSTKNLRPRRVTTPCPAFLFLEFLGQCLAMYVTLYYICSRKAPIISCAIHFANMHAFVSTCWLCSSFSKTIIMYVLYKAIEATGIGDPCRPIALHSMYKYYPVVFS